MALTEEQLADIRSRIPARPETDIPMPYEDLVRKILTEGTLKSDRTGTGTISLFGQQMRFDLSKYFPLLTTKTVFFKGLAYELLWFLKAGLKPGEFVWTGGDCHVYDNHVDQFLEQLGRKPYPYPTIEIRKADSLFDYQYEDFKVVGYQHHPTIKAPVAV